MEHDVNEETRPHTLDFKVERAIKNKTFDLESAHGTSQATTQDNTQTLNMIEKAKHAIRNELYGRDFEALLTHILKDKEKAKSFMILYNKEEKI